MTQQVTILHSEIDIWKKKYTDANRDLHQVQEELTMKTAEYESL
jgi:predicted  nucleic acid-binding Zn-ribbon protein